MANKKNATVSLNIDTQIENKKALESLLEDLKLMQSKAQKLGLNLKTINSALVRTQELIKAFAPYTKNNAGASRTVINNFAKELTELSQSLSKIHSQLNTSTIAQEDYDQKIDTVTQSIKDAEETIQNYRKELERLEKQYKRLTKEDSASIALDAIKARKTAEGRKADTKSDKFLRTAAEQNIDIFDPVAKQGVDPDVYNKAVETYLNYIAEVPERIAVINTNIDDLNSSVIVLQEQLEKLKATPIQDPEELKVIEDTTQAINKMGSEYKQQVEQMKASGQTVANVTKEINKQPTALGKATRAIINYTFIYRGLINIMKEAVNTIADMDNALTGMAVVTGKSREELDDLVPSLHKLALETSSTMTDIANLTTEFVRQGRTIKDSLELAEQTAKAAQIAGISTSESLEYMTSAINGFNLAAKDAEHVSDVFAKLGAITATDYENLAVALSKVSAQANTAGLSLEFTTSLLAKGIETTQEAPESIGTALKTILARMREMSDYGTSLEDNVSINKVEKALKAAGIALRDTNGQFRDMESIFTELGPQWDNLNTMQQQAIAQAVAGTRQQSRFLAIMQDWDRTIEISAASQSVAGETAYQYSQYMNSMSGSLTRLQTAFQGLIQNLTDTDFLIGTVQTVESILTTINDFFTTLEKLGPAGEWLQGMIVPALAIGAIIMDLFKKAQIKHQEALKAIQDGTSAVDSQGQQLDENASIWDRLTAKVTRYNDELEKVRESQKKLNQETESKPDTKKKEDKQEEKQEKLKTKRKQKEEKALEKEQKKKAKATYKEQKKTEKAELARLKKQAKEQEKVYKKAKKDELDLIQTAKKNNEYDEKEILNARKLLEEQDKITAEASRLTEEKKKYTEGSAEANKINEQLAQLENKQKTTQGEINGLKASSFGIAQAQKTTDEADLGLQVTKKTVIDQQNQGLFAQLGQLIKNTALNLTDTIITIAKAVASMVGIGFAAAAAGILVTAGISGLTGLVNKGTGKAQREEVSQNQEDIHENKADIKSITDLRNEYEELLLKQAKGITTAEDEERMSEIANSLKEIDSSIVGIGSDLLKSADRAVESLEDENRKKINDNYKNLLKVMNKTDNWFEGKNNLEFMKSDEGRLAAQQYIEYLGENSSQQVRDIQEQIFSALDWSAIIDKYKDSGAKLDTFIQNFYKDTKNFADDLEKIGTNDISGKIKAYRKALENANDDTKKALQSMYGNYDILSNSISDIEILLSKGFTGDKIENFVASLTAVGTSAQGASTILQVLSKNLNTFGNSTEGFQATFDELLNYSDEEWAKLYYGKDYGTKGKTLQDFVNLGSEANGFKKDVLELAISTETGLNLEDVPDTITTISSARANRYDIVSKLLKKEKLETEDYETLANMGLASNTKFMELLVSDPIKAALKVQEQLVNEQDPIIQGINTTISRYESIIKNNKDKMKIVDAAEKERLEAENELYQEEINIAKARLKNLEAEYEILSKREMQNKRLAATLSAWEKKLDQSGSGNLASIQNILGLYKAQQAAAYSQLTESFQATAASHGIVNANIFDYFDMIEGSLVPIEEKWDSITSLDFKQDLTQGIEEWEEYTASIQEATEAIEEYTQQAIDDAIANQEYLIELAKTQYEQEAEELQKSLDERREMYDKYFDDLEGKEDETSYESDRQALLNRIAKLSTATDATSLAKLKEAQEELQSLDEERISSQRDARREAVSNRLDKASENIEEQLEKTLADANKIWKEILEVLKEGSMTEQDWRSYLSKIGTFEGMTDLAIDQYMKEFMQNVNTTSTYGYNATEWRSGYIGEAVKQEALNAAKTYISGDNSTVSNITTTFESIVIGSDVTNEDQLKNMIDKAVLEAYTKIAQQNGINANLNN